MSDKGQKFYTEMKKGIDNHDFTAKISIAYGKDDVHTGNFIQQSIDIADVQQFSLNRGKGATQAGKLAHEFTEQFEKAKNIKRHPGVFKSDPLYGYNNNHTSGCISENAVNNNTRERKEFSNTQKYHEKDGSTSTVSISSNRGIITVNQINRK